MNDPSPETAAIPPRNGIRRENLLTFLRWSTLALLIWCVKLWVIRQHGDSCPFGDEWGGEAAGLLKPAQENQMSWSLLFSPFNEHRIFMTRLFVLALFKGNGLWDPRLQMAVQALLHAAGIASFLFLCTRRLSAPLRRWFMGATLLLWTLPLGWENTLFGFQSQFYFVILFGVITIWLLWRNDTFSPGWWAGVLVAIIGLFTMASGVFAVVISAGLMLGGIWAHPSAWRRKGLAALILATISAWGIFMVIHGAGSNEAKARTLSEFIAAWRIVLSWPQQSPWCFIVIQAPILLLLVKVLRNRTPFSHHAWLLLALAGWGLLQTIGLAYGRARLTPVAPRYLDVYVLLLCASFACFCEWFQGASRSVRPRRWALAFGGLWMLMVIHGALSHFVTHTMPEIENWTELKKAQGLTVTKYLETHDPSVLAAGPSPLDDLKVLQTCLDDPTIVEMLPTSLRTPLTSTRQMSENSFFNRSYFETGGSPTPGHLRYWSSYGPNGLAQTGELEVKFPGSPRPRWMEFFVAGAPNAKDMSLTITDKSGQTRNLAPQMPPDSHWKSVVARIPPGSFSINAQDGRADQWLAVSNPRPIGLLSHSLGRFLLLPESDDGAFFTLPLFGSLVIVLGLILCFWSPLLETESPH